MRRSGWHLSIQADLQEWLDEQADQQQCGTPTPGGGQGSCCSHPVEGEGSQVTGSVNEECEDGQRETRGAKSHNPDLLLTV